MQPTQLCGRPAAAAHVWLGTATHAHESSAWTDGLTPQVSSQVSQVSSMCRIGGYTLVGSALSLRTETTKASRRSNLARPRNEHQQQQGTKQAF